MNNIIDVPHHQPDMDYQVDFMGIHHLGLPSMGFCPETDGSRREIPMNKDDLGVTLF